MLYNRLEKFVTDWLDTNHGIFDYKRRRTTSKRLASTRCFFCAKDVIGVNAIQLKSDLIVAGFTCITFSYRDNMLGIHATDMFLPRQVEKDEVVVTEFMILQRHVVKRMSAESIRDIAEPASLKKHRCTKCFKCACIQVHAEITRGLRSA